MVASVTAFTAAPSTAPAKPRAHRPVTPALPATRIFSPRPIGMKFSPALDQNYLNETYKVSVKHTEMKEVKRQDANNGILISATKIRQCLTSGYFNDFDLRENKRDIFNPAYQDYLDTYNSQQEQKIIICYQNKTALEQSAAVRTSLPVRARQFGH
jgi:hypothetical protein